jgi:bifunctional DNase/RNase
VRWLELTVVGAVALCLRLYRIQDYTAFQGDQGVDALVVKRFLVDGVLPLEGPATSAGGVHLGPFYYYLLALPMRLDWLDPLADAALMALLGGLTTGLVYLLARSWFGRIPALVAASASAVSPAAIVASRSAWNPAPTPFFVLLALLGIEASRRTADGRWLVLVGPALACLLQLHYFTLAVAGVLTIAAAWLVVKSRSIRWAGWMVLGLALGGVLFAPLLLHELTTGFPNLHAASELLVGGAVVAARPDSLQRRLRDLWMENLMTTSVEQQMIEMRVVDVRRRTAATDTVPAPRSVVVLREVSGERRLPIWVGNWEADAIAMLLEKLKVPRPLTHAFTASLLRAGGVRMIDVRIHRLAEETFYAQVVLQGALGEQAVDARPSDCIALALELSAPIYVATDVLTAVQAAGEPDWLPASIGAARIVDEIVEHWPREPKPAR